MKSPQQALKQSLITLGPPTPLVNEPIPLLVSSTQRPLLNLSHITECNALKYILTCQAQASAKAVFMLQFPIHAGIF